MDELTITENGDEVTNSDEIVGDGRSAVLIEGDGVSFTNAEGGSLALAADSGEFPAISVTGNGAQVVNQGQIIAGLAFQGGAGDDSFINTGTRTGGIDTGGGSDIVRDDGSVIFLSDDSSANAVLLGAGDDAYFVSLGAASFLQLLPDDSLSPMPVASNGGAGTDTFILEIEGALIVDGVYTLSGLELSDFEVLRLDSSLDDDPVLTLEGLSEFQSIIFERAFDLTVENFDTPDARVSLNGSTLTVAEGSSVGAIDGSDEAEIVRLISDTSVVTGDISLGGGSDTLIVAAGATLGGTIDGGGGTGADQVIVAVTASSVDLASFTNFERVGFSSGSNGLSVSGDTDATELQLSGQNITLTGVTSDDLLITTLGGGLTIAADQTVQSVGSIESDVLLPLTLTNFGTITSGVTLREQDDTLTNNGAISGGVLLGAGNDEFTNESEASSGLVEGGEGNDALSGGDNADTLDGGTGNDLLSGGLGADTLILGSGADEVRDTAAGLSGDTIDGFGEDDFILIEDEVLSRSSFTADEGTEYALNQGEDTFLTFSDIAVDFSAGDLFFVGSNGGTLVRFEEFLADLSEGVAVEDTEINGVFAPDYISSETANSFTVTLEPGAAGADFDNSLGVYEITETGDIADVRILAADVTDGGTFTVEDVEDGHQLGFFIIQNGANTVDAAVLGSSALSIEIDTGTARLADGGSLVAEAVLFVSHDAALNPNDEQHVITGVAEDGSGALRFAFEDLIRDGSADNDFQDVVFEVEADPSAGVAVI